VGQCNAPVRYPVTGAAARRAATARRRRRLPSASPRDGVAKGNKGCERSDAAGKQLVPSFVHFTQTWISSKHVAYQSLSICGGRGAGARGSASSVRADAARRMVTPPVGRSSRVNVTATLSNSEFRQTPRADCEMFAVTDSRARLRLYSPVCRVSDDDSGYGDDLVNIGRIAVSPGGPEFGLSLLCPNVSRPVRPIAASYDSTPGEADSRHTYTRVRTPCGAPGQPNYTSWCVSGFSQVFVPKV
jgi:hypothetical protein